MDKPIPAPRFRFSLLALLGFVAFVAVGCAALANPTEAWLAVIQVLTFFPLVLGIIFAVHGENAIRAFWLGFIATGWGYLVFGHFQGDLRFGFPTEMLTELLLRSKFGWTGYVIGYEVQLFSQIANLEWTGLLGFISGVLTRRFYLRRKPECATILGTPQPGRGSISGR